MNYRLDKYGNKLSILGFGCMRFQRKQGKIDMALAEQQIMAAYKGGVNYYDTAYIYPGSEAAIGEIFEKNGIREKNRYRPEFSIIILMIRFSIGRIICPRKQLTPCWVWNWLTSASTARTRKRLWLPLTCSLPC